MPLGQCATCHVRPAMPLGQCATCHVRPAMPLGQCATCHVRPAMPLGQCATCHVGLAMPPGHSNSVSKQDLWQFYTPTHLVLQRKVGEEAAPPGAAGTPKARTWACYLFLHDPLEQPGIPRLAPPAPVVAHPEEVPS